MSAEAEGGVLDVALRQQQVVVHTVEAGGHGAVHGVPRELVGLEGVLEGAGPLGQRQVGGDVLKGVVAEQAVAAG